MLWQKSRRRRGLLLVVLVQPLGGRRVVDGSVGDGKRQRGKLVRVEASVPQHQVHVVQRLRLLVRVVGVVVAIRGAVQQRVLGGVRVAHLLSFTLPLLGT